MGLDMEDVLAIIEDECCCTDRDLTLITAIIEGRFNCEGCKSWGNWPPQYGKPPTKVPWCKKCVSWPYGAGKPSERYCFRYQPTDEGGEA